MELDLAMKKLAYAVNIAAIVVVICLGWSWVVPKASAQCTGIFPTNTLCGNLGASAAPPAAYSLTGAPILGPIYYATNYGVKCDGTTDDVTALNSAITSAAVTGGIVQMPRGTCIVNSGSVNLASKVQLLGAGNQATILTLTTSTSFNMIEMNNISSAQVTNLGFNPGGFVTGFCAIQMEGGSSNISVTNNRVTNIGSYGICGNPASYFLIAENNLTPPAVLNCSRTGIIITATPTSTQGKIINNVLFNTDIEVDGNTITIQGNTIQNWKCGSGIVIGPNVITANINVVGNTITGGLIGSDNNDAAGIEHWAPDSIIANNIIFNTQGPCLSIGGQFSVVIGNLGYNCGLGAAGAKAGITLQFAGPQPYQNGQESFIIGNTMTATASGYVENAAITSPAVLGPNNFDGTTSPFILSSVTQSRYYALTGVTTVGGLPPCTTAIQGARMFVTDNATSVFTSVTSGAGAVKMPVYCDGSSWRQG